ncbi:MAG TPA: LLM class F420-dependent oxidoreductase [Deltaproteobacteria bacterium]|jgi:probable F420-dependent oxidoreductase|nr:LLM class F420-dependent oxidoreductase [Deltaproteobacteria bacterium]
MKIWQSLAFVEPDQLVPLAHCAEECGFHGILLSDHLAFPGKLSSKYPYAPDGKPMFDGSMPFPDPWVAIAAMAQVTNSLRFATLVYVLPLRDPFEVAKSVGTAAVLSNDRLVLGAGVGWMKEEFDAVGIDFRTRGQRFDEMIEVMRKLWSGRMVEHHGKHFEFGPMQISPVPGKSVPLYVGGVSEAALRRAATLADGWMGAGNTPEEVPEILARLRELRKKAGREKDAFTPIVPLKAKLDRDLLRRMEGDYGLLHTVSYPFQFALGPTSPLEKKRDFLRRMADELMYKA